ncbi:MAG: hypothetical protein AMXMBFR64_56980 [Myxococcales bacterium]
MAELAPRLEGMDEVTRERLVQLACVAAWSDFHVAPEERKVVLTLAAELAIGDRSMERVYRWLDEAPPYLDPQAIPVEHRAVFLDALQAVIRADGRLDPAECETLRLIKQLVA